MIRRLFRRLFRLALVIGAAAALYKVVQARKPSPALPEGDAWPPTPKPVPAPPTAEPAARAPATAPARPRDTAPAKPAPPKKAPAVKKAEPGLSGREREPAGKAAASSGAPWVEPVGGVCPATHPVKAKVASSIYHLPGMMAYERTNPDRCYRDEKAAQADGFRKAKR